MFRLLVNLFVVACLAGAGVAEAALYDRTPWTPPGVTVSSPAAYGAAWGDVFIGGGVTSKTRTGNTADGAIGVGLGLGDPNKYVGVETSVAITDVTGFQRGGVSVKIHRNLPASFAVAVGREFLADWGGADVESRSFYGSVSKTFFMKPPHRPFSSVTVSAGVGNGRFRSETDFLASADTWNVFGSAAIRVLEPISAIVDWNGQDLNAALSITPFRRYSFFISPGVADITGNTRNGVKFILSGGFAYNFSRS